MKEEDSCAELGLSKSKPTLTTEEEKVLRPATPWRPQSQSLLTTMMFMNLLYFAVQSRSTSQLRHKHFKPPE